MIRYAYDVGMEFSPPGERSPALTEPGGRSGEPGNLSERGVMERDEIFFQLKNGSVSADMIIGLKATLAGMAEEDIRAAVQDSSGNQRAPRKFADMDDSERTTRLADAVRSLITETKQLSSRIWELNRLVMRHSHDGSGSVVERIDEMRAYRFDGANLKNQRCATDPLDEAPALDELTQSARCYAGSVGL